MDVLGAEGSAGALVLNRGVQRQMQAHKPIIRLRRLYWSRALSNLLISVERSDPRQCRIQLRYLLCLPAWTRARSGILPRVRCMHLQSLGLLGAQMSTGQDGGQGAYCGEEYISRTSPSAPERVS